MITLKCQKHPRYHAQLPPRAACKSCIDLYDIVTKNRELVVPKKTKVVFAEPERLAIDFHDAAEN